MSDELLRVPVTFNNGFAPLPDLRKVIGFSALPLVMSRNPALLVRVM
jgi:hypothetical protein